MKLGVLKTVGVNESMGRTMRMRKKIGMVKTVRLIGETG
jgi:hypothetical protein